jgi:hypothetical protein
VVCAYAYKEVSSVDILYGTLVSIYSTLNPRRPPAPHAAQRRPTWRLWHVGLIHGVIAHVGRFRLRIIAQDMDVMV